MGKRKSFHEEEKEFNDIISLNSEEDIRKIKSMISNHLPNSLKIIAKNENQKKLIKSIKNKEITICSGLAGSGKTYVALAFALSLLNKSTNRYKKIYLVKSVTPLKGEELGFLKGDLNNKIEPFMMSYFINIEKLINKTSLLKLIEEDIIKPFPLAYLRGVTLDDCIIILDEAQNVSIDNSRTFMTRIGSNAKMIILGDRNQVDLKIKEDSSLDVLMNMFEDTNEVGCIKMNEEDVNVRNPLIKIIEEKYNDHFNYCKLVNSNGNGR